MSRTWMVAPLLFGLVAGCKDEPGSAGEKDPPKAAAPEKRSNVVNVSTALPPGKKVPCTKLLDVARLSAALGKEVTLKDTSATDSEAAAVCQIKLAGTPPSAKEQERMFNDNDKKLGILPGDEICMVTAYCALAFEVAEVKKKCEADGQNTSTEIGLLTCVKSIEAGPDYRYIYSVIDGDSKCRLLVNPGPSVVDEATVKQCAKAAADLIGPDQLKE